MKKLSIFIVSLATLLGCSGIADAASVSVTRTMQQATIIRLRAQERRRLRLARLQKRRTPAGPTVRKTVTPPVTAPATAAQTVSAQISAELASIRNQILILVNQERAKENLPPLRMNAKLEDAAQKDAQDMDRRDFFDHVNPDGLTPQQRMNAAGYVPPGPGCNCSWQAAYGENIAHGQETSDEVMHDWMNSEHHRENILDADFEEIGIGYVDTYWVQNFGSIKVQN